MSSTWISAPASSEDSDAPSMGTYDRALQWRMMQQRHPHAASPYFASGYALPRAVTSELSAAATAAATASASLAPSSFYASDDRQGPLKRQRLNKLSPGPQRSSPLASYLPSADGSSQYNYTPTTSSEGYSGGATSQEFGSDWFQQRSSSGLTVNTAAAYSSENGAALGRSLASPTTMFGMENLMADYESGFYSLWNGSNGANVMGYDGDSTPSDRPSHVETSHVYMPEEELKMDYPQLPDLNQGDLDYIYGTMDPATGRASEPHIERQFSGVKRDRPAEDGKLGSGLMSPTQTSLISPLPPSGFRSLARNASIETKRPPTRTQPPSSYLADSTPTSSSLLPTATGSSGAAASRRPPSSTTNAAGAKRPRSRQCDFPGCENRARSHQKCKKHGGAHQCVYEGCMKNSQSRGLCIAHGGGSRCKIDGCTRASQSKGRCKSHGGGEYCAVEGCRKKAHLKHLCRTHGGGVRCKDPKCMKWAQRKGWCMAHAKEVLGS